MFYTQVAGWSWRLLALVALDLLHIVVVVYLFWPLWGVIPRWLERGRTVLMISLAPLQILCGGLCPIVWLQQCIAQGKASWFTRPFIYKLVAVVSPWEVSELAVSAIVTIGGVVLVGGVIVSHLIRR